MREVIIELAARHGLDAEDLLEDWAERAAIREYLGGATRRGAELDAMHEIERTRQIGLHCPETRRAMAAGGQRRRPAAAVGCVHARVSAGGGR